MAPRRTVVITTVGAVVTLLLALLFSPTSYTRSTNALAQDASIAKFNSTGRSRICISLATALPDSVFSQQHPGFKASQHSYWSAQASEYEPACIVRPSTTEQVSKAVKILKAAYDEKNFSDEALRFAVRSGGHSPEAGFASINGGILIDTSLISGISVSANKTETRIGTGAHWVHVSEALDEQGLAVAGGRNSDVGVGGLVLGGGISFFSPQVGMVCDNILRYEIVLADGSIATVSDTENPTLWRALKGGTGNFGIVTHVTARTFPGAKIWAGYVYWTNGQSPKLIRAFHDFAQPENFDKHAAGPILAFVYVQKIGLRLCASNVAYTKPEKWPSVWSGFDRKNIWRLWSSARIQSLSDATREVSSQAPPGVRQFQVTTTVRCHLETLSNFYKEFGKTIPQVKKVKNLIWTLVFQPLSSAVRNKGSPNVLGLQRDFDDSLVIVLLTTSWSNAADDQTVYEVARALIAAGEAFAERHGTADRYRYLNYAASGQKPFDGYGEENKKFLQDTSREYDPSGFWQMAKVGGFKLDLY